jgi:hypothetical protein
MVQKMAPTAASRKGEARAGEKTGAITSQKVLDELPVTGKPRRNQFLATDGTRMKHGFVFQSPSGLKSLWQNMPPIFQAPFRSGIFWNPADDAAPTGLKFLRQWRCYKYAAPTALRSRGRENRPTNFSTRNGLHHPPRQNG